MNKLPLEKRVKIIQLLVEGNSLRSTSRIVDVSINTVTKLLVEVGKACQDFHNETVIHVKSRRIECDEIWSFVYAKNKNVTSEMKDAGDVWTFVGIDSDTKLVMSWLLGHRDIDSACVFMQDVRDRIQGKVQITTDGLKAYIEAVDRAFETDADVDYGMLVKMYKSKSTDEPSPTPKKGYSKYVGAKRETIFGTPNPNLISTSYVERQNLTMRMHMRRFTRKTNAFSKKIENHGYAIALHFVYYNFAKIHTSLRVTPAMQAGLTKRVMKIEDIVRLAEIN